MLKCEWVLFVLCAFRFMVGQVRRIIDQTVLFIAYWIDSSTPDDHILLVIILI